MSPLAALVARGESQAWLSFDKQHWRQLYYAKVLSWSRFLALLGNVASQLASVGAGLPISIITIVLFIQREDYDASS